MEYKTEYMWMKITQMMLSGEATQVIHQILLRNKFELRDVKDEVQPDI